MGVVRVITPASRTRVLMMLAANELIIRAALSERNDEKRANLLRSALANMETMKSEIDPA